MICPLMFALSGNNLLNWVPKSSESLSLCNSISSNDFIMQLFRKGYAYEIGDDILIKKNDMLER